MSEPWFSSQWAFLPGTVLGCLLGLWGTLMGVLGSRGKAKGLIVGGFWVLLGASVVLLIAGLIALITGQPYGVWYGLGLAGLIGVLVLGFNGPMVFRVYRQAELRRMEARDLGQG